MSEHAIYKVMRAAPVNQSARRMIGQARCSVDDQDLSRDDLKAMLTLMQRKARLLKLVLGLNTKAKQKNFRSAMKGRRLGSGYGRAKQNPRASMEYIRLGEEIYRLGLRIGELKQTEAV